MINFASFLLNYWMKKEEVFQTNVSLLSQLFLNLHSESLIISRYLLFGVFFSILNIVLIILTKLLFGLIYKFLPTASLFSFREYYGQALWAAPKIIKFFSYNVQEPKICQKIKNVIPVLQSTSR